EKKSAQRTRPRAMQPAAMPRLRRETDFRPQQRTLIFAVEHRWQIHVARISQLVIAQTSRETEFGDRPPLVIAVAVEPFQIGRRGLVGRRAEETDECRVGVHRAVLITSANDERLSRRFPNLLHFAGIQREIFDLVQLEIRISRRAVKTRSVLRHEQYARLILISS